MEIEDEVDWSDGSLDYEEPIRGSSKSLAVPNPDEHSHQTLNGENQSRQAESPCRLPPYLGELLIHER